MPRQIHSAAVVASLYGRHRGLQARDRDWDIQMATVKGRHYAGSLQHRVSPGVRSERFSAFSQDSRSRSADMGEKALKRSLRTPGPSR